MPLSQIIVLLGLSLVISASTSTIVLRASPINSPTHPLLRNDGIHLAVSPRCVGTFAGAPGDVNAGLLPLATYKTLVTFGDSYTDGGIRNGSTLLPPVLTPPSPKAGERTTNGPVWAEDLVADTGARLMDYAFGGAVTDQRLWPSKANHSDFIGQVKIFLNQSNDLDPDTTLYSSFFGINDVGASKIDGSANLPLAAQTIITQITLLTQAPTNGRHFLIIDDYALGAPTPAGEAYKQVYFSGLGTLKNSVPGLSVAFVDLKTIWDAVLGVAEQPRFREFGYTSSGACTLSDQTVVGACADPAHTFYWIPGHPSKETHRIMADYIEEALSICRII